MILVEFLAWRTFLELAPLLEKLELLMYHFKTDLPLEGERKNFPLRPNKHLRTVHMSGFRGYGGQIELARFILEHAVALEHMTIDPRIRLFPGYEDRDFIFIDDIRYWVQLAGRRFGKVITVL